MISLTVAVNIIEFINSHGLKMVKRHNRSQFLNIINISIIQIDTHAVSVVGLSVEMMTAQ